MIEKFGVVIFALLLCACDRSEEHVECVDKWERTILCPPDGVTIEVLESRRHEYPDATEGLCKEPPDGSSIGVFHAANLVFVVLHKMRASAPSRWAYCAGSQI